jgi:hypothetical protein
MKTLLSAFIIFVLMFSTIAFAETRVNVDLEKLPPDARNAVINAQKEATQNLPSVNKENLALFKDYGKAIAETFAEVCKTLNVEVNNFANTPVGKLTMWLIVYKVVGKDIIHIVLTIGLWLAVTIVCATYAYIFHMPKKFVKRDANKNITEIQYIQKYKWNDNGAKAIAAFICAAFWAVATLVAYLRI